MHTLPEALRLRQPFTTRPARGGFRVPFGVRAGRIWSPGEVAKGKACGCSCPGCGAPLSAKAQASRRKRPHFAHLVNTGCVTGRETGIHLRAKQLIADRRRLLLPAWEGESPAMPNPPVAQANDGRWLRGRRVDMPGRQADLRDVRIEARFGDYTPDVVATDEAGLLLIEIRVTHAVDDRKTERVYADGHRMVEIDLSRLDRHTPHDPDASEHAVLADIGNRAWIAHPEAVRDWTCSKADLDGEVAARNAELVEERRRAELAANEQRTQAANEARVRAANKEFIRRRERARHEQDLAQLPALTDPARVQACLDHYACIAEARVTELRGEVPAAVCCAALRWHPDAWIFGVHPSLWQLLAYRHFIAERKAGDRFNQRDVASWVRRSFPADLVLYRLFVARYAARAGARRAGFAKRTMDYWVFTEAENERIPDFYAPINEFIVRLAEADVVRLLPAPTGECEVLGRPPTGLYPIAHTGAPPGATTAYSSA